MLPPDIVIARFAESVGKPDEARHYIKQWQSQTPERFALIDARDIKGDSSMAAASALLADLHYLVSVRLPPVVVGVSQGALAQLANASDSIKTVETPDQAIAATQQGQAAVSAATDVIAWQQQLASRKVVLLSGGGLRRADGQALSLVNVTNEAAELLVEGALRASDSKRFALAADILTSSQQPMTVGVCSPFQLLRELFTVNGAGTLLRLGSKVSAIEVAANRAPLARLLSDAFGRSIRESFFERALECVLVAGEFRGAAIVENASPAPYLSKFAVGTAARGEGIGHDLWRELTRRYERLVWRSRTGNPIAAWYANHADGLFRQEPWTVYWRGIGAGELASAIALALERPDDFEAQPSVPLAEP